MVNNVEGRREVVLSAYSAPSSELRTLFTGAEGSIRRRLENPPVLRYAGFDLETGDHARSIRGELVRVSNGDRKVLDLYRDGTFIMLCRADDWFLAWGSPKGQQRLNPLALVEVVYGFALFYNFVVADLATPPSRIKCRVDLRNMHRDAVKTTLTPYAVHTHKYQFDMNLREAPENDKTLTRIFQVSEYAPDVAAFELVREIYFWFGFDEDQIPYARLDGGVRKVDVEAIRNIK